MASSSSAADGRTPGDGKLERYETGIPGLWFRSYDNALFAKVLAIMAAITLGAFVAAHLVHALGRWFGLA